MKILELQHQLTPYQQKKCDAFFYVLKVNDYIYPGHFKSKLNISMKFAYEILEELKIFGQKFMEIKERKEKKEA